MKSFEFFIAKRYVRSKRRTAFISTITYISFLGITLGVAVLIITMSVMNGFENEVRSRFLDNESHLRVRAFGSKPFKYTEEIKAELGKEELVLAHSPYIEMFAMIKGDYTEGALIKGIDTLTINSVSELDSQIVAGSLDLAKKGKYPGIILGKNLADRLAASLGEKVRVISPAISSTFSQPPVKVFIVTGIFETGLSEIDAGTAYIDLNQAGILFKMPKQANGAYIKLKDFNRADEVKRNLNEQLDYPLMALSWKDLHKNLYAWMYYEKIAMTLVLSLIILIAGFNILSSLIMVVMEKKKDIGILMAMGAGKRNIASIFINQGMIIGITGTIFGSILGLSICFIQLKFKIISLPSDVYFIDSLPVIISPIDCLIVALVAIFLTFIASVYPASQASKMLPAEIIRND